MVSELWSREEILTFVGVVLGLAVIVIPRIRAAIRRARGGEKVSTNWIAALQKVAVVTLILGLVFVLAYSWDFVESQSGEERSVEGDRTGKEHAYIRQHERRIRNRLKSPEQAEFRNVRAYYAIAPMVCGEVNANNNLGGRGGWQRFISGGDLQLLEEDMATGEMEKTWARVCR